MVKCGHAAAAVIACLTAGQARAADWGKAGGSIFVGEHPTTSLSAEPRPAAAAADGEARLSYAVQPFAGEIARAAERYGLDPKLLHALVIVESAYDPAARSDAGAVGLTQLMRATAVEVGVPDRRDPAENLLGGASYLARQLVRFRDVRLALAAYNAGPARVARLGRVPTIPETRAYVSKVVECYLALSAGRGARSAGQCSAATGAS